MHAVVLVGGFGTRLRPLTNTVPKAMLPIAHVPLLVRLIGQLERGRRRPRDAGPRLPARAVRRRLPRRSLRRRRASTTPSSPSRSTPPARSASPPTTPASTTRSSSPTATCSPTCRSPTSSPPTGRPAPRRRSTSSASTTRRRSASSSSTTTGGSLRFVEKPPPGTEPSNLINAGTYVLEPSVLDRIPLGRAVVDRARDVPRRRRRRALPLAGHRRLLDRRRPARALPAGQPRPRQRPPRRGVRGRSPRRRRRRDGASSSTAWSGGAVVGDGATVTGSVVLPGAVIGRRRGRRGLDRRRHRRPRTPSLVRTVVGVGRQDPRR